MKRLVDSGIEIEFKKDDKNYFVRKDIETDMYSVISHQGTMYKGKKLCDYEVEDTADWKKIEEFLKKLSKSNEVD